MTLHVDSEVGQLKQVIIHEPGLELSRLTPANVDDLLFDDVMWVETAKRDHFDFIQKMRDRGVEVVEMHNLLTDVVAIPEAYLADSAINLWNFVRPQLASAIALALDNAVLFGLNAPASFPVGGITSALHCQDTPVGAGPPRLGRRLPHGHGPAVELPGARGGWRGAA